MRAIHARESPAALEIVEASGSPTVRRAPLALQVQDRHERVTSAGRSGTLLPPMAAALLASLLFAAQAAPPVDPQSRARVEADVRKLVSFGTRHTLSETEDPARGIGAARRWLAEELERISREHHGGRLRVLLERFALPPGRRVPEGVELANVVALLPGRDEARLVVVCGHYDSICGDVMDSSSDAPGANDDASGTAVVLECARLLAGLEPRAGVVFLAVAGEEQGLLGSRAQAEAWKAAGIEVEAFLGNDIVGGARGSNGRLEPGRLRLFSEGVPSAGPKIAGSDCDAPSRQLARYLKERGERALPGFEIELVFRQDRFGRGGDHKSFNDQGFAAVRFTEPNENYDQQHAHVRVVDGVQKGDLAEFVDYAFVARVAAVNAAGLRELALAPPRPKGVRMSTRLGSDTRLTWEDAAEDEVAGWRVRVRRTWEPTWSGAVDAGRATEIVLEGYSKDDWIFAVEAFDAEGHASLPVYPQAGR